MTQRFLAVPALIVFICLCASLSTSQAQLLTLMKKPATWTTMIVDKDNQVITDKELTDWLRAAQLGGDVMVPKRKFSTIAVFTQCFGGGFLQEIKDSGLVRYGANSASTYFQPAAYKDVGLGSYYGESWLNAAFSLDTDQQIADNAWLNNPRASRETAQYVTSGELPPNGPPQQIDDNDLKLGLIFAGLPNADDEFDISGIIGLLLGWYSYDDVLVLFGDGTPLPDSLVIPDRAASKGELIDALAAAPGLPGSWLQEHLANEADDSDVDVDATLFIWIADHGNVDTPLSFSVETDTQGQPNTSVNSRFTRAGGVGDLEKSMVYEGGKGRNISGWEHAPNEDIDAIATGRAPISGDGGAHWGLQPLFFSVDEPSVGADFSGVQRESFRAGRAVGPDVFVAIQPVVTATGSNRQAIDGGRTLGLTEPAVDHVEELNALSLAPISPILLADSTDLSQPIFYSVLASAGWSGSNIYVYDPDAFGSYVYLDWVQVFPEVDRPQEIDAMVLSAEIDSTTGEFVRHGPDSTLRFDPDVDRILYSVSRDDASTFKVPCNVYLYGGGGGIAVWAPCADIGLVPPALPTQTDGDNVDALDILYSTGESNGFIPVPVAVRGPQRNTGLQLDQNYPNPFNPSTTISYFVRSRTLVDLTIYDVRGRRVRNLVHAVQDGGEHLASWNGRDARGTLVSSGVYFSRLTAGGETAVRKLVLLK